MRKSLLIDDGSCMYRVMQIKNSWLGDLLRNIVFRFDLNCKEGKKNHLKAINELKDMVFAPWPIDEQERFISSMLTGEPSLAFPILGNTTNEAMMQTAATARAPSYQVRNQISNESSNEVSNEDGPENGILTNDAIFHIFGN